MPTNVLLYDLKTIFKSVKRMCGTFYHKRDKIIFKIVRQLIQFKQKKVFKFKDLTLRKVDCLKSET